MSFHVDDEELQEYTKKGARAVGVTPPKPVAPKPPEPQSPLAAEMRELAVAVKAALVREPTPEPDIHVAAPQVTVKPEINVHFARSWQVEVTERNPDRTIKMLRFTAIG